jgi:hypothetical protein
VQETRWHRSERTEPQPDGSLVWRAQIAEPKEMLPWIRGWGADVEVLGPEGLRGTLEAECERWRGCMGSEMEQTLAPPTLLIDAMARTVSTGNCSSIIYAIRRNGA